MISGSFQAVRALEHAHVPVHRFIGAPEGLPQQAAGSRRQSLTALRRRAGAAWTAYGETLGRLQKAA